MIHLVNAIILCIGTIWMIMDRVRFERTKDDRDRSYAALFREHNTLLIVLLAALCFYCFCEFFSI